MSDSTSSEKKVRMVRPNTKLEAVLEQLAAIVAKIVRN